MVVDSRYPDCDDPTRDKELEDIPTSYEDQHFGFQKDAVSMIDLDLANVYKFNYNVIEEILVHEKMWRYWPRRHTRINPISQSELWHEPGVLEDKRNEGFAYVDENHVKAYNWLEKRLDRCPENFLLYKTWEETVDNVMYHYAEDYEYFEGVKFVNGHD